MGKLILPCIIAVLTVPLTASQANPAASSWMYRPYRRAGIQFGVASWYGKQFQGLPTASGLPFDMNAFICAHRHLPLGTRIRVTDLLNSRSLVLKVTDRGPYVGKRVLDVSRAAAQHLGFRAAGLAPVRIEVVASPPPRVAVRPGPAVVAFSPQHGASANLGR